MDIKMKFFKHSCTNLMYSALSSVIEVTWKPGQKQKFFESEEEILRC